MKPLKVLMTVVLTIFTISLFAQTSTNLTTSKKEQMKMTVMKITTASATGYNARFNTPGNYKDALMSTLSPKELMKTDPKADGIIIYIRKTSRLKGELTSTLSPKELMKIRSMNM